LGGKEKRLKTLLEENGEPGVKFTTKASISVITGERQGGVWGWGGEVLKLPPPPVHTEEAEESDNTLRVNWGKRLSRTKRVNKKMALWIYQAETMEPEGRGEQTRGGKW